MTNKELIEKLVEYFLTQDPKVVARSLAGCLIDFNRLAMHSSLPREEQKCLQERLNKNLRSLHEFAKNGASGDLKTVIQNSAEDDH